MDINDRYTATYEALNFAVAFEMNLMEQTSKTTNLHARRALLMAYGEACTERFALERELNELREEMRIATQPSLFKRLLKRK